MQKGDARNKLAISDLNSSDVHVYDVSSGSEDPLTTISTHATPVAVMRYVAAKDTLVSIDKAGKDRAGRLQGGACM